MAEGMTHPGWSVGVVVPACNEEATIEACVVSIRDALAACAEAASSWIVVVADSCADSTVELARAALGDSGTVIECAVASPGLARRRGANDVLRHFATQPQGHIWIANTDADSQPQSDWIMRQLQLADDDYCGVAGIVHIQRADVERPEILQAFWSDYALYADGSHPHVHGANLGIRADAYMDAGGWGDLAVAEDHALWACVRARGWHVISSISSIVTTSGRLCGRARGGFADALRRKTELIYA
jgi:cellulose synthase/poly-beta-1,6-N-acetylglucosamine synthase-like glycosyltransferase